MQHFKTLAEYCAAIQVPPPKHDTLDIRRFAENMPTVVSQMPPFRHSFYAIALKIGGKGKAVTSHYTDFPEGSVVFFNSPFQIISWDIAPDWEGYYVMFTQDFLARSPLFNDLLGQFPFLKIDQAIPFAINAQEETAILDIFDRIYAEYHSAHTDKFDFLNTYILLLLNHVKRSFHRQMPEAEAEKVIRTADLTLLSRYQKLIETELRFGEGTEPSPHSHSPSYYADLLSVHPNHLNAVVKSTSGKTALQLIHAHLVHIAKSYLSQTSQSIKEIAYQLQFDSPNSFSSFFKKHTQQTPGTFRKEARL